MDEQGRVKRWFEETYRQKGFGYLRPFEAYGIYAKLLGLQPGERFLDVACGPGLMLRQAVQAGAVATGFDISETAVSMAQQFVPEAHTETANAEQIPLPTGSVDAVTCLGSLERMLNLEQVLREIYRVAGKNGRFCFLVRNSGNFTWQLFMERLGLRNEAGHQGAKSLSEWTALFEQNGFAIQTVLPDQWPFVRWGQALSLGLYKPDPLVIRHGLKPLNQAYEFIFLLRKQ